MHDIIPITHTKISSLQKSKRKEIFERWFNYVGKHHRVLTNSQSTCQEIQSHLEKQDISPQCSVVRFPHEFKPSKSKDPSLLRQEVKTLSSKNYVLCVGTIEIRKNIFGLLHAWRSIINRHEQWDTILILAGGRGWEVDDVYRLLAETNNINGSVAIVDRPNDLELETLYKNCRFTVFPSFVEGWGLPIGESLWFSKPVICAQSSAMAEAGGRFAAYFSHDIPGSLEHALEQMLVQSITLPADIRSHLTTWHDTALSVLECVR